MCGQQEVKNSSSSCSICSKVARKLGVFNKKMGFIPLKHLETLAMWIGKLLIVANQPSKVGIRSYTLFSDKRKFKLMSLSNSKNRFCWHETCWHETCLLFSEKAGCDTPEHLAQPWTKPMTEVWFQVNMAQSILITLDCSKNTTFKKKHPDPVSDIYLHVSHPGYVFDLPPNSLEESLGAQPYLQFHRFEGHVWKTDLSRTRCPRSVDLPNSAKVHSLSSAACHLPCATEMSVRSPFLQVLWCKASLGLKIRPFSINGYHKTVSLCQLRGKIINWSERITRNPDIFDRQIYRFP